MRSRDIPIAIAGFLTIVAAVPALAFFAAEHSALTAEDAYLAALVPAAAIGLFVVGWVRPSLAEPLTGAFVLVGLMLLAPWLFRFSGMAAGELAPASPLARLLIRFALPVLILAAAGTLGYRRLRRAAG